MSMSKLSLTISKVPVGEEMDFADALQTIASQISEAVVYGDGFHGKATAGDAVVKWVIVS